MPDISAILKNPADFGFEFQTDTVHKYGRAFQVPLVSVTDLGKFDAAFPGMALKAVNGTSVKVGAQRVSRDAAADQHVKDANELKTRLVKWLLGIEQPKAIYPGPGDEKFASKEEAEAAWKEWARNQ